MSDADLALSILRKMAAHGDCWMLERFACQRDNSSLVGHAAIEAIWFDLTYEEMSLLERLDPSGQEKVRPDG